MFGCVIRLAETATATTGSTATRKRGSGGIAWLPGTVWSVCILEIPLRTLRHFSRDATCHALRRFPHVVIAFPMVEAQPDRSSHGPCGPDHQGGRFADPCGDHLYPR